MNPHEETWRTDCSDAGVYRLETIAGERIATIERADFETRRLLSQAPAMARLLLEVLDRAEASRGTPGGIRETLRLAGVVE